MYHDTWLFEKYLLRSYYISHCYPLEYQRGKKRNLCPSGEGKELLVEVFLSHFLFLSSMSEQIFIGKIRPEVSSNL
jgi:hypothetical protein